MHQFGHLFAEFTGHIGVAGLGILDRVVQKRGHDRRVVQPLLGQNGGNGNRMRKIGLARLAELPFMHPFSICICPTDQVGIGPRVVIADKGDEVFDVDHPRLPFTNSAFAVRFHKRA